MRHVAPYLTPVAQFQHFPSAHQSRGLCHSSAARPISRRSVFVAISAALFIFAGYSSWRLFIGGRAPNLRDRCNRTCVSRNDCVSNVVASFWNWQLNFQFASQSTVRLKIRGGNDYFHGRIETSEGPLKRTSQAKRRKRKSVDFAASAAWKRFRISRHTVGDYKNRTQWR